MFQKIPFQDLNEKGTSLIGSKNFFWIISVETFSFNLKEK